MDNKTIERFEEKIFHSPDGCHYWLASTTAQGYGYFRLNGVTEKAHRFSYTIHRGSIPDGLCVCHSCDNPYCVNPDHLFLGTRKENSEDRDQKGRTFKHSWETNGKTKLSAQDVETIKGLTHPALLIAQRFGVSRQLIYDIWKGRRRAVR